MTETKTHPVGWARFDVHLAAAVLYTLAVLATTPPNATIPGPLIVASLWLSLALGWGRR